MEIAADQTSHFRCQVGAIQNKCRLIEPSAIYYADVHFGEASEIARPGFPCSGAEGTACEGADLVGAGVVRSVNNF